MAYTKMGDLTVVPSADLTSLTSDINVKGDARVSSASAGTHGVGKRAGMIVVRDAGSGAYSLVFATGSAAADVWRVVDGSATYTPV